MRITTEKWMKDFDITKEDMPASGLIDGSHTSMVIPRTEAARMDVMMNAGFAVDDEKNKHHYLNSRDSLGSIDAKDLNAHCKGRANFLLIGMSIYDPKLLRQFTKHFNRAKDKFAIYGNNEEDAPLRIISPCRDWAFLVAPRIEDDTGVSKKNATPIGLDKELW
tara:strand:- start:2601 stop:3092 length:492 start_codon:yes stop_codon:yes gene_type:complete